MCPDGLDFSPGVQPRAGPPFRDSVPSARRAAHQHHSRVTRGVFELDRKQVVGFRDEDDPPAILFAFASLCTRQRLLYCKSQAQFIAIGELSAREISRWNGDIA